MASSQLAGEPIPDDGRLPESAVKRAADKSFHAYLHIPFCSVRCGYCDFNTYTATELQGVSQDEFYQTIISEIEFSALALAKSGIQVPKLKTIFFGGGTPTKLQPSAFSAVLNSLVQNFGFDDNIEITTEANPDDLSEGYLEQLAQAGVNRISIGMQSSVDRVLKILDRTHNPEGVAKAVGWAKALGLKTSVDLIYGSPTETLAEWRQSLEAAFELDPGHISAYSLIVEDGTKMARKIKRGELPEPDSDLQADMYELLDELAQQRGYRWYELSNFAKSPDLESAHNIAYWQNQNWWGYGPGAHSHVGGVRWWNKKHPATYSESLRGYVSPGFAREVLDVTTSLEEQILLQSRLRTGLPIATVKQINPEADKVISTLISDGLIEGHQAIQGKLVLSLSGRLLADRVIAALITG